MMKRAILSKLPTMAFLASRVKHELEQRKTWGLSAAFLVGCFASTSITVYKRRQHLQKVDRMYNENSKLAEELSDRSYEQYRKMREHHRYQVDKV